MVPNATSSWMAYPVYSFFRLTAARNRRIPDVPQPRIEGPGVNLGVRVCALKSPILGAESKSTGFTLVGNKFGWPQVFPVGWECGKTPLAAALKNDARVFLDRGTATVENVNRLIGACRLTGTGTARKTAVSKSGREKQTAEPQINKKTSRLKNLIFTTGNPSEGQQ